MTSVKYKQADQGSKEIASRHEKESQKCRTKSETHIRKSVRKLRF